MERSATRDGGGDGPADSVLNTICPVCGATVDPELPPVNLSDPEHARMMRICSLDCADLALLDPEHYLEAAAQNQVADDPEDRPVALDPGHGTAT